MKTHLSISMPKPCSKQFSQFKTTINGGYCNTCKQEVIDFRQMPVSALVNHFKQHNTKTCGIFKQSQLHNAMQNSIGKQQKTSILKVAAIAVFSILSLHTIQAQNKTTNTPVQKEVTQNNVLRGIVLDEDGPLAGANILLKDTRIGATADFDGKFKFPKALKEGDVLLVSYLGYKTQKVIIKKGETFLNIKLSGDDIDLLGAVEVNAVYSSKRK